MDVSVIVCTYERVASLALTLRALDEQVVPPGLRWELLVVDNNSTDGTRRAVDAFVATARIPTRYFFEGRQGLSHARNAGIAHAAGAILAFTDDDVRPAPDWVAAVAAVMRETGVDVVGGRISPLWQRPPPPWLATRPFLRASLSIMEHGDPRRLREAHTLPTVWGANMAFRREVLDRIGGFNPRLGMTGRKLYRGEEVDLVQRALDEGFRARYDPRLLVWHRIPADRMRRRYVSRLYFERAEGEELAQEPRNGRRFLGAPLFLYRQVAGRLGRWLWAAARRRPDALDRWLDGCELAGSLWGHWKRRFKASVGGRGASGV